MTPTDRAAAYPGLGVWASCPDYGLDHEPVPCSAPFGETGEWKCCLRCADSWQKDA